MGKKDPRVDAYIAKAQPFAKPILKHIRTVVHQGCPTVEEAMKWSFPAFMYKGILCGMGAFKAHCTFGFWKDSLLSGGGDKPRDAMGQYGRITSVDDLPDEKEFLRLIREAMRLNDEGVKVPRTTRPRPPIKPPKEFLAAVRKNKKALTTFESFSPSHKRDYLEWITEAKTEATRKRRLDTAVEWMAEGKTRNWKYEPKKA